MPTQRTTDRVERGPKSRNYVLGSFFGSLLTVITDPRDGKAILMQSDPAYLSTTKWQNRPKAESIQRTPRFKI